MNFDSVLPFPLRRLSRRLERFGAYLPTNLPEVGSFSASNICCQAKLSWSSSGPYVVAMDGLRSDNIVAYGGEFAPDSALPPHVYGSFHPQPDTGLVPTATAAAATIPPGSGAGRNPAARPRQLSEEEWENLRDIFHTYYMQENKTLDKIVKIMREQHGLVLT